MSACLYEQPVTMRSPVRLVRNIDAGRLLDTFLISSITTVLATRFYLHITGYPQIGSSTFHIAHLLPGGLLMLTAILIMLATFNRSSRDVSAFIGGIGFGLFWDELGKFITRDNNYFFEPTAALIYVSFVMLYLITRVIVRRSYTPDDYLANALSLITEGAIDDLDPREYRQAAALLKKANPNHPLYKPSVQLLEHTKPTRAYKPFLIERIASLMHQPFKLLARQSWFRPLLITSFYIYGVSLVLTALLLVTTGNADPLGDLLISPRFSTNAVATWSSLFSAFFVLWGILLLHKRTLKQALQRFEIAVLINIFIAQVFLFLEYQFSASVGLAIALCILFSIRMLLAEE